MKRQPSIERLFDPEVVWDVAIVGGGATGVGAAVDAASRGYRVCLVEQSDFGKGTSSRSTKLIHGGVRYLQQGNISLVMEALEERGLLRQNAPHLVHDLAFVVPNYDWWEAPFYGIGMKVYDMLAGEYGFGKSRLLTKEDTLERIPTLTPEGLRGGVLYYDGQFDDARLLVDLAQTADQHGAALVNYCRCVGLTKDEQGFVNGLIAEDLESGRKASLRAHAVVNATGCFTDAVRQLDEPGAPPIVAPSQGVHVVLDGSFLSGDSAIMVPRTSDGRVLFAIPWHGRAVVGTTDTPIDDVSLEPRAFEDEIAFILETAAQYLHKAPSRADVLSVFAGIRPLIRDAEATSTASISREHSILISGSGLLTIAGGKWTTYRKMAQDCSDQVAILGKLEQRPCVTKHLPIHGHHEDVESLGPLAVYGTDAAAIQELAREDPALAERLHPALPITAAWVIWAVREEMAMTVDDVLSRRSRSLLLDASAAIAIAPRVASLLARERGKDRIWEERQIIDFRRMAKGYLPDRPVSSRPSERATVSRT